MSGRARVKPPAREPAPLSVEEQAAALDIPEPSGVVARAKDKLGLALPLPDPKVMAERRELYSRYAPAYHETDSQVPAVLQVLPEFRALAEERRAVESARRRMATEKAKWQSRKDRLEAQYRAALADAVERGFPPPEAPPVEPWPYDVPAVTNPWSLAAQDLVAKDMAPGSVMTDLADVKYNEMLKVLTYTEIGLLAENHARYVAMLAERLRPLEERVAKARAALEAAERDAAPEQQAVRVLAKFETARPLKRERINPETTPDPDQRRIVDVGVVSHPLRSRRPPEQPREEPPSVAAVPEDDAGKARFLAEQRGRATGVDLETGVDVDAAAVSIDDALTNPRKRGRHHPR